jgi:integrase
VRRLRSDPDGRPLVTFHGLRHTAASILLADGVPLIVVSRFLGHANANVTAKVYAHLERDESLEAAAQVFDRNNASTATHEFREQFRDEEVALENRMAEGI